MDTETELQPDITPDHLQYIQSLHEPAACYTRFFDALLIPKPSHSDFLHDLQLFRQQPSNIALLQQAGQDNKDAYRECTRSFLSSEFADPWGLRRTTTSTAGISDRAFGSTSSLATVGRRKWLGLGRNNKKATAAREVDAEVAAAADREEDRLHRLLVPLWIAFRRRMFPDQLDVVLEEWVVKKQQEQQRRKTDEENSSRADTDQNHNAGEPAASGLMTISSSSKSLPQPSNPSGAPPPAPRYPELGFRSASARTPTTTTETTGSTTRGQRDGDSSAAASQMFLGVAVTGFLMSDKRVRKYMEKQFKH
ncbi:hypothetical protein KCU88_g7018, partial [Aureobasidium melanogenum]